MDQNALPPPPPPRGSMPPSQYAGVPDEPRVDAGLVARVRGGASWFYWIAALTAVNAVLALVGSSFSFSLGLTFSTIVHGIVAAMEIGTLGKTIAFVFDLCACGALALFGVLSMRGMLPMFWIGTVLFGLDTLLVLPLLLADAGSVINLLIHGWALFSMVGGAVALGKLKKAGWQG